MGKKCSKINSLYIPSLWFLAATSPFQFKLSSSLNWSTPCARLNWKSDQTFVGPFLIKSAVLYFAVFQMQLGIVLSRWYHQYFVRIFYWKRSRGFVEICCFGIIRVVRFSPTWTDVFHFYSSRNLQNDTWIFNLLYNDQV